jgi:hypothetical protein
MNMDVKQKGIILHNVYKTLIKGYDEQSMIRRQHVDKGNVQQMYIKRKCARRILLDIVNCWTL